MWGIAKDKKIQDQNLGKSSDSKFWYSSKLMALCVPVGKECCGVVVWRRSRGVGECIMGGSGSETAAS